MSTIEVPCRCGQAERQRVTDRDVAMYGREPTTAPHTASCPVVLAEGLEDAEAQLAEAESLVPMFGAEEHDARLDGLRARRDRLRARLAPYLTEERGSIDPTATWWNGESRLTGKPHPRKTLKGDQA